MTNEELKEQNRLLREQAELLERILKAKMEVGRASMEFIPPHSRPWTQHAPTYPDLSHLFPFAGH